jgi:hypothetical protein
LKERQPKNLEELVEMAEAYQNAHRGSISQKDKTKTSSAKGNVNSETSQQGKADKKCSYCQKAGHLIKNCPLRKQSPKTNTTTGAKQPYVQDSAKQSQSGKDRVGLIQSPTTYRKGLSVELPVLVKENKVCESDNRERPEN